MFIFLGEPGTHEPLFLPVGMMGRGGSSGPPQGAETKKRARDAEAGKEAMRQATTASDGVGGSPEGEDSGGRAGAGQGFAIDPCHKQRIPSSGGGTPTTGSMEGNVEALFLRTLQSVDVRIKEQTVILRWFAEQSNIRLGIKRKAFRLEALKAQLNFLPAGSPGYQGAMQKLEALVASDDDEDGTLAPPLLGNTSATDDMQQ